MELEKILAIFSERLQDLIRSRKLNEKEFAEQIGIPQATVNSWTTKRRTAGIDKLYKIAIFFGVTTDYLLGLED